MKYNQLVSSEIISCSRRTDVPAFLMDWVLSRINDGYVDVVNPFDKNQISRISLNSENARVWIWWSKNFENWISKYKSNRKIFNEYHHFFNFTLNSPSELESGLKVSLENRFFQLEKCYPVN